MRRSIFAITACAVFAFSTQSSYAGFLSDIENAGTASNGAAIGGVAGGKKGALIGAGAGLAFQTLHAQAKGNNEQQKAVENGLNAEIATTKKKLRIAQANVQKAQKAYDEAVAKKNGLEGDAAKAQDEVIARKNAVLENEKQRVAEYKAMANKLQQTKSDALAKSNAQNNGD